MTIFQNDSSAATSSLSSDTDEKLELLGLRLDNMTMDEALDAIAKGIDIGRFCYAVTPNVDHVMKLRHDDRLRTAYEHARFVFADGVPLLWAAKLLGRPLKQRINGTDLFERLCESAEERGYRIFLLGGNHGTAEAAACELQRRHPALLVAGWEYPEFGFEKDAAGCANLQRRIAASGADILFVGLGAPKQEEWILRYGKDTGVSFAVGIGVSFSFVGGEIERAPLWMQRRGLEWLWRLFAEPARLWRRYLVDDIGFVPLVLRAWLSQMTSRCRVAFFRDS